MISASCWPGASSPCWWLSVPKLHRQSAERHAQQVGPRAAAMRDAVALRLERQGRERARHNDQTEGNGCSAQPVHRQALEQLCHYITRPAPANERVQTNAAGRVVLKLKTPWRDGTRHLLMSPLQSMQRLAALVPRPRLRPARAAWRRVRERHESESGAHRPVRLSWSRLLKRVFEIDCRHAGALGGRCEQLHRRGRRGHAATPCGRLR